MLAKGQPKQLLLVLQAKRISRKRSLDDDDNSLDLESDSDFGDEDDSLIVLEPPAHDRKKFSLHMSVLLSEVFRNVQVDAKMFRKLTDIKSLPDIDLDAAPWMLDAASSRQPNQVYLVCRSGASWHSHGIRKRPLNNFYGTTSWRFFASKMRQCWESCWD